MCPLPLSCGARGGGPRAARRTPTWKPWRGSRAAASEAPTASPRAADPGRPALRGGRRIPLRRRERVRRRQSAGRPPVKLQLHPRGRQTVADQLFAAGVEFPCGGESACGGCKVRVLEGDVPVTATMRDALGDKEIREGWRLACCASAAERVVVEVEQWSLRVLSDDASVPIEPRTGLGAAIDLGTTTLVVQVVDLSTGEVQRVETALNRSEEH